VAPASDAVISRVISAVIVLCLAGLAASVALSVSPSLRQRAGIEPAPLPPAYAVGEVIDVDPALYRTTRYTLLVMARSTCGACQQSRHAYAEFVRLAAAAGIPSRLTTTERERGPEVAFAADMGIPADAVSVIDASQLRVTHVPLLFLIDSTGVILHLWPSIPDDAQTADVRQTLRLLAKGVE